MATTPIQKVSRAIASAEAQLSIALINYTVAIKAYNINGIATLIAPLAETDVLHPGDDSQTKSEFLDQITFGANAVKKLSAEVDAGGRTLLGTDELDEANTSRLAAKLAV